MNASTTKHSADEDTSITKIGSDNETDPTLPNGVAKPRSNLQAISIPDGSVMWAGPEPSGEGARSEGPDGLGQKPSDTATGVTEPPDAKRVVGSGAAVAHPDAQAMEQEDLQPVHDAALPKPSTTHPVIDEYANEHSSMLDIESANDVQHAQNELIKHSAYIQWLEHQALTALGNPIPEALNDPQILEVEVLVQKVMRSARKLQGRGATLGQSITAEAKTSAFVIVKTARSLVREIDEQRSLRKDTEPGAATIEDYQKKLTWLDTLHEHEVTHSPERPWVAVFDMLNISKSTFSKYRTAVKWRCVSKLVQLLAEQDQVQRSRGHDAQWYASVQKLDELLHEYREVCALAYGEYQGQENWPPSRLMSEHKGKSKKHMLAKLPKDDWQERFLFINERSATYRQVGVLLRFCGVRPAEIESGIGVRWTSRGVRIFIRGAKTRATAGQPWRSFVLSAQMLPQWFTQELQAQGYLRIKADADALRTHLNRLSTKVLNPQERKNGCNEVLSAYVFRHALVTELRESGWDTDRIAAVLGESSAETVRLYGTRVRGGKKLKEDVAIDADSVKAARAIKPVNVDFLKRKDQQPRI